MKPDDYGTATIRVLILGAPPFVQAAQRVLSARAGSLRIEAREGGIAALGGLAAPDVPDVIVLQDGSREPGRLASITQFTRRYPQAAIMLVCPTKDPDIMMQALHSGVKEFLFEPLQEAELTAAVKRLGAICLAARLPAAARGEVMAFLPCKGGSGSTFLATNIAHALASERHKKVLLIDMNLQFGDAYLFLMDSVPPSTLTDVCAAFSRLDGSFLESACAKLPSGLDLLAAPKKPEDAELVKPEHIEAIVALARMRYDFVVLDISRTIDAVALKALDLADHIYPVYQMILPHVRNAARMKETFRVLDYTEAKVRWIVNRYGSKGEIGLGDAQRLLPEAFWTVPNDHKHVTRSVNQGIPVSKLAPHSPSAKSLIGWAAQLSPEEARRKGGLFRWFRRS